MKQAEFKSGPTLGDTLQGFAVAIGEEVALRLSAHFGGRQLYVPRATRPDSELRKLHQFKWGETIAMGIKPGPMVAAMRTATATTLLAATLPPVSVSATPLAHQGGSTEVRSGGALPPIEIHINVHVQGGAGSEVRAQARQGVAAGAPVLRREVERILREYGIKPPRTDFRTRGG